MADTGEWHKQRALITVRTYPAPSRKSVEVSCTAGVTEDGRWIRLYPIPYRFLEPDKRYRKYQFIEANVRRAESDPRPESYHIDIDSIKILSEPMSTNNKWQARKDKLLPLMSSSLCSLQAQRNLNKEPTLGLFKPKTMAGLKIVPTDKDWSEKQAAFLAQYTMFGNAPKNKLQKVPFTFYYEFTCDEPNCRSHTLSCADWEMGASYWGWREKYGANWEVKFRQKFATEMISKNDTHFFVGTLRDHPDAWIIVGLFYPPR